MRTVMHRIAAAVVFTLFLLPALLPGLAAAQSPDLERAYKKEFAYLEAQKRALEGRLAEVDAQAAQKSAAVQAEVDRLQGRQMALAAEADRLQLQLVEAERDASFVEERSDALVAMMEQARASLAAYEVEVPALEVEGDAAAGLVEPARVEAVFGQVATLIDQGGQVRTEPGAFFLADGQKVAAEIVRVGRVAAYGVSPRGAGALAPAGEGALKLWGAADVEGSAAATARALAAGAAPDQIGVFLYENLDRPIEERAEQTLLEFIDAGGVIGWVIVGIGLLALLLTLIRALDPVARLEQRRRRGPRRDPRQPRPRPRGPGGRRLRGNPATDPADRALRRGDHGLRRRQPAARPARHCHRHDRDLRHHHRVRHRRPEDALRGHLRGRPRPTGSWASSRRRGTCWAGAPSSSRSAWTSTASGSRSSSSSASASTARRSASGRRCCREMRQAPTIP